jgi:hypothetical protein
MWDGLKNVLAGASDLLGIDVPEAVSDLTGTAGDAAAAAQGLTESATGLADISAVAGEQLTTAATDAAAGATFLAAESAAGAVPGIEEIIGGIFG